MWKAKTSTGGIVFTAIFSFLAAAFMGLVLVINLSLWPSTPAVSGAAAKIDGLEWNSFETSKTEDRKESQAILYGLNEAMKANDKEAFIAWGEGDGQQKLSTWWDITKQIGWEYASVDGRDYGSYEFDEPPTEVEWFFSSELGSRITTLLPEEKGLILTQGEDYRITLQGKGEDARIISMESVNHYFAWSYLDGNVHVVKRDNSVTVGKASEVDYIESKANLVEAAAVKALEIWPLLGGELPTNGLLAQVSQHQSTLDEWTGSNFTPGIEYAGLAVTSDRPYNDQPYIDPKIASGERTSGSFILMSPRAESDWSTSYESTLLHEVIHAFHRSAYPLLNSAGDRAASEGLATYSQMKFLSPGTQQGYHYFQYAIDYEGARQRIAGLGFAAFDEYKLTNNELASEAYLAAGLAYDYAASNGVSAWSLALAATTQTDRKLGELIIELGNGTLSEAGYSDFVLNKQF